MVPAPDGPDSPRLLKLPSRRGLFRAGWVAAATLLAWGWGAMGLDRRRRQRPRRVSLPRPGGDGVTLHGDVALSLENGILSAFDARCPHLGCRISRVEDGVLVCPCHGSRFDAAGRRLAGPATTGLRRLAIVAPPSAPDRVDVDLPA